MKKQINRLLFIGMMSAATLTLAGPLLAGPGTPAQKKAAQQARARRSVEKPLPPLLLKHP